VRVDVDRRRSGHPGRAPARTCSIPFFTTKPVGQGDRAWAWTPRARSWRSTTRDARPSTPARRHDLPRVAAVEGTVR
jgi:hypothetical protein